jgi:lysophospholipase L1-like esterase
MWWRLILVLMSVGPLWAAPNPALIEVIQELQVKWPKNHTINFVCHGHSVPSGYFKTPEVHSDQAYPAVWQTGLRQAYPHAVLNVIVTAIGGENSVAGAARFQRDVLSLRPEVVTIDYSLNDRRIGLPAAKQAWSSMIVAAKSAGIKVILLTPTPDQSAKWLDPQDPLSQHAEQVRALAQEHQVLLVDSLALFQAKVASGKPLVSLMSQVNHPNADGHALVAEGLINLFRP